MVLPVDDDQGGVEDQPEAQREGPQHGDNAPPAAEAIDPLRPHRLTVSGWFTTTDAARAVGVESAVVSLQPCEATTPLFNT